MKLCNIHIKNLIILLWSVSGIPKGLKKWKKVAEICYQLVHDRASRSLALFLIWRHRLIYMVLILCEHACKTVFDVKLGIDPCPLPARSWDKAYQISGCTVARKKFRCCEFDIQILFRKKAGSVGVNAVKHYLRRLWLVSIATILSKTQNFSISLLECNTTQLVSLHHI